MRYLTVINPISGNLDKDSLVSTVKSMLSKDAQLKLYKTCGEKDQEKLQQEITDFQPNRILVIGGDGTIKLVAEAMGEKSISLGIIPAGSANGLANDLNLPLEMDKAIAVAIGKKTQEIDAIKINGQLSLHISDFGVNAELVKNFGKSKLRGKIGYALNSFSTLYNSDMPYQFKIETEEGTKTCEAIMLAFANSRKYGTGAVVNPNGKIDDGVFEILIFKRFDIGEILKTLHSDLEMSPDFLEIIHTTKASVSTLLPIAFQIDGEYCDELKKVEAEILPKKLCIAVS